MDSIFITGIGGFIGMALARRALERGGSVSGVDTSPEALERARALGADARPGDIADARQMREALRAAGSVDTVIHTAAIVREHGALEEFRRINVQGSVNVARAALEAGARTFVQLSSVMVYGFDFPEGVTETGPLDGAGNPYCQTKIESEAAVRALADAAAGFGVIVIRPGDVYGPGSVPWIARPLAMLRKRQMLLPIGGQGVINHVYVENLVDGIFLAIDHKAHGDTFNLTDGVATTYADFYAQLARRAGLPGPTALPTPLLFLLARGLHAAHRLGLSRDDASPDTVRYLMRRHAYSIEHARRTLGYVPKVGLQAGLDATQAFIDAERSRQ
jgi:nucleoside-diphosphate-sugar epimerase